MNGWIIGLIIFTSIVIVGLGVWCLVRTNYDESLKENKDEFDEFMKKFNEERKR